MLVPLDNLDILAIVDNEVDPMSPPPAGVKAVGRLPEIAFGKGKVLKDERGEGLVKEVAMEQLCCGAHGLSLMITATHNEQPQTLLFDVGPTESIFTSNAQRLQPPLQDISHIHLSHWHRDHSGGMLAALRLIKAAKSSNTSASQDLAVDLHPARPEFRGARGPPGVMSLEPDPKFEEIEQEGGKVVKSKDAHEVLDSYFLVSGEIPRLTEYEEGFKFGVRYENGTWIPDTLIMDERFVVCHVKDKGLVVFTGCSHAGVVNAARHALELTGNKIPLHAIVGGFHLADAEAPKTARTVSDLKDLGVKVLIAGHCTGWRAKFEIEKQMPGSLVPSFVGIKTTI